MNITHPSASSVPDPALDPIELSTFLSEVPVVRDSRWLIDGL